MDTLWLDRLARLSLRFQWVRRRGRLIPIVAVALGVGAFLQWGPIGLGNGPLRMGSIGDAFGGVSIRQPVAIWTPFDNMGRTGLIVDGVEVLGNSRYPAPRVLAMETTTNPDCGTVSPIRTTAAGFVIGDGCSGRPLGRLEGRTVQYASSPPLFAAFELRPPQPGACWLMTRIVVRYHVGIRHYVATDPYRFAACTGSRARAERIAAAASR